MSADGAICRRAHRADELAREYGVGGRLAPSAFYMALVRSGTTRPTPVLEPLPGKVIPDFLVSRIELIQVLRPQFFRLPGCDQVLQIFLQAVELVLGLLGQDPSRPPVEERLDGIDGRGQRYQREP
jgi:hypothetical protein